MCSSDLGAATVALVLVGRRLHPLFPGVLLAVIGGIVATRLGWIHVATVGDVPSGIPAPSFALPWSMAGRLLLPALTIAVVGFAEPSAIARHYASADRTAWDPNREFVSQGLANVVTGLFRAYPVGSSFSRSALNRLAGAETRWSGIVTALLVLAFLPFSGFIAPLGTLADEESQRRKLADEQALAGELRVMTRSLSYARAEDLRPLLTSTVLSQRGSIQTDVRTNTLIINDLPDRLERTGALIATLDSPQPQVEIEARIVQTTRDFARNLGVQWGVGAKASADRKSTRLNSSHT